MQNEKQILSFKCTISSRKIHHFLFAPKMISLSADEDFFSYLKIFTFASNNIFASYNSSKHKCRAHQYLC